MPRLGKKRFGGGWERERKEGKKKKSCGSIHLSPWPLALVTGRLRLDSAGLVHAHMHTCARVRVVLSLPPRNAYCGSLEMDGVPLSTLCNYSGWEAARASA